MRIFLIALFSVLLVGCTTTKTITNVEFSKIEVPKTFQECPVLKRTDFPTGDMTNAQVHSFILKLYKNNQICAANMKAITDYINKHNASVDNINKVKK